LSDPTFAARTLRKLIAAGSVDPRWRTLVVCGGPFDELLLQDFGFTDHLITSIVPELPAVSRFQHADAQNLPFEDGSFDLVMVHAGLHHCASPHRALTEMYRVASKMVIAFEAQDSRIVRAFARTGIVLTYEFDEVNEKKTGGGVNNTTVPNYIYRWTRREVEKVIRTYDAAREPRIRFFSEFVFFEQFLKEDGFLAKTGWAKTVGPQQVGRLVALALPVLNFVLPRSGNSFAIVIDKREAALHPWLTSNDGRIDYDFSR
jgi:SAM-dependent methyltransferase